MGEIVGCFAMSHAPQLMLSPENWGLLNTRSWDPLPERTELQSETLAVKRDKWDRCMAAIGRLRDRVTALAPDTVLVVGDDQHENLLDDNLPPFAIYVGDEVEASVSLRYLKESLADNRTRYRVDAELAMWLTTQLMDRGFDPAFSRHTRYAGGLGHAFARVLKFLLPEAQSAIVPIMVNTYYPPAPSARRCIAFGQAVAQLVDEFPEARRVVVIGSGGLSHTRLDESLDHRVIGALERNDLAVLEGLEAETLIEGTSEIRNWIVTAGVADRPATVEEYQPLYRTTNGVGCGMGFAYW
jgi:aromatic ring-opening dioxygenase catalytic subunit (LigB family)